MTMMLVIRILVLSGLAFALAVALTRWAVLHKHLQPFGPWARFVRRLSDPLLAPIEQRLVRAGRNPQDAIWWLLGIVVVAGLLLMSLSNWLVGAWFLAERAFTQGPRGWAWLAITAAYNVLVIALFVRIIGSWFGVDRHRKWIRPAYVITDWLINPIRRILPPMGLFDFSPLLAWLLLVILRNLLLRIAL
jgi:YggT family protein